jgi:hypothetical protein
MVDSPSPPSRSPQHNTLGSEFIDLFIELKIIFRIFQIWRAILDLILAGATSIPMQHHMISVLTHSNLHQAIQVQIMYQLQM